MEITITVNTPDGEDEYKFKGTPDEALQDAVNEYPNATSLVMVIVLEQA